MSINISKRPDYLASGESARLIPVVSDGGKEGRATSILLANLSAVHEFAQNIFGAVGVKIGTRTNIEVFTEVVFKDNDGKEKTRPDGLIIINTGRTQWKAIVEAKIGNAELGPEQVKDYLTLAKKYKIDAVITISNQYSALPTHHPVQLKNNELRGVELYHWSWMFVQTEAILLLKSMGVEDADQRFLLNEMVRYYSHPSVGVTSFTQMNKEWKDVASKVQSGAALIKTSEEVEATVASWHQEARDLCLQMSQWLAVPVSLKLSRNHKLNPVDRLKKDCEQLVSEQMLRCELDIPNAASPYQVHADLTRRTINCSMRVQAPKDKKRSTARLNWLLRQIKDVDHTDIFIRAITQGRSNNVQASLAEVLRNPNAVLLNEGVEAQPIAFEVMMVVDLAGRFSGRSVFIQELEKAVRHFYENVGQHLRSWTPDAPKVITSREDESLDDGTIILVSKKVGHQEKISVKKPDDLTEGSA